MSELINPKKSATAGDASWTSVLSRLAQLENRVTELEANCPGKKEKGE